MEMIRSFLVKNWKLLITLLMLFIVIYFILPISTPLMFALISAIMLNPAVEYTMKKAKFSRNKSVITVFILFILLFVGTSSILIIKVISQTVQMINDLPTYLNHFMHLYNNWESNFKVYTENLPPEIVREILSSLEEYVTSFIAFLKEKITIENISSIFAKVPNFLVSLLVYLISLFLFMLELTSLKNSLFSILKKETKEKVVYLSQNVSKVFLGYVKAQFSISLLIFIISLIGLLIIKPEVALMMSLIIWLIDLLPILGSIIVLAPWSLYSLLTGEITLGLQLAMLAAVLLIIRRTIEPKVMSKQIGLSPLATIISMFLGLKLIGFLGLFLGPLAIILFTSAKQVGIINWNIKF